MDKIWQIASVLLCLDSIWCFKDGNISAGNQKLKMALMAQILSKMEEGE